MEGSVKGLECHLVIESFIGYIRQWRLEFGVHIQEIRPSSAVPEGRFVKLPRRISSCPVRESVVTTKTSVLHS